MTVQEDLAIYFGSELLEIICDNYNCCHENEMSLIQFTNEVCKYLEKNCEDYYKEYLDRMEEE